MSKPEINEIWYVPTLQVPKKRRPLVYYEHMSPTRKGAIEKLIMNSYRGAHDWAYRKKLGWTIERIIVSNA